VTACRLPGRACVLVNTGSELARACALRLADEGAELLLVDPSFAVAQRVAEEIAARGGHAEPVQAAPADEEAISRVAQRCEQIWGRLDVLVVTAGELDWWSQEHDSVAMWERSLRVNLLTPVFFTKLLLPLLARSDGASVVYYGSIDGLLGNPRVPAYSVGRGGLVPYTHLMAGSCGAQNIRVNYIAGAGISPEGPEAPQRQRTTAPAELADLLSATPLARAAEGSDVAGLVAFLASPDAAYITGTVVVMDGGRCSMTPGTAIGPPR
jgi:NAD(P)-dependent dehydrogenase (short-subunit alcohol dehydrogenase family)